MTERSSEAIAAALEAVADEWPNLSTANSEVCLEAADVLRRLSARCAALEQAIADTLQTANLSEGDRLLRAALSTPSEEPQR